MIIYVHVIASIHSERIFTVAELISLLQAAHTGDEKTFDVPNTMLVSELIVTITTQLGMNSLQLHEPYLIEKDNIVLDDTKTLEEAGVVVNDSLHLRVTLLLA